MPDMLHHVLPCSDEITLSLSIYRALNMDRWKAQTHVLEQRLFAWATPHAHIMSKVATSADVTSVSEYNMSQLYIRVTIPAIQICVAQTQYAFMMHVIEENLKVGEQHVRDAGM